MHIPDSKRRPRAALVLITLLGTSFYVAFNSLSKFGERFQLPISASDEPSTMSPTHEAENLIDEYHEYIDYSRQPETFGNNDDSSDLQATLRLAESRLSSGSGKFHDVKTWRLEDNVNITTKARTVSLRSSLSAKKTPILDERLSDSRQQRSRLQDRGDSLALGLSSGGRVGGFNTPVGPSRDDLLPGEPLKDRSYKERGSLRLRNMSSYLRMPKSEKPTKDNHTNSSNSNNNSRIDSSESDKSSTAATKMTQHVDPGTPGSSSRPRSTDVKFKFPIDVSGVCDTRTLVVLIVCSAWENVDRREVIRRTWASVEQPRMRVLFLIGQPGDDRLPSGQRSIESESATHGDLIQANFIDTYANLSLKSIAMLQWTASRCRTTRFLVKVDDDVFVNTPLIFRDLELTRHHRFVMGNVIAGARPSRDPTSKWYTPADAYAGQFYPKYISGAAYVISGDLVRELYDLASTADVFWIEDVFITGLLLTANRIRSVQHIYNGKFDIKKELDDACLLQRHILRHLSRPNDMIQLWALITSQTACSP